MRSDLGVAKGDWVRAVLIAFWDSVTTFFSKGRRTVPHQICFKNILLYCVEKLSSKDFRHSLAGR